MYDTRTRTTRKGFAMKWVGAYEGYASIQGRALKKWGERNQSYIPSHRMPHVMYGHCQKA